MEKSQYRGYIQIRTFLGDDATKIFNDLRAFAGDLSPSYDTVRRWTNEFSSGKIDLSDQARSGRPIVETTPENIERVKAFINADPYCTYNEMEASTLLSRCTLQIIINDHLSLRKLCARWIPHFLTEHQKKERVRICKQNLANFESNRWRLYDVITGDESWFYHRKISSKQSNASWVSEGEKARTVVRRGRFDRKTMFSIFFKSNGPVCITYLEGGKTIDHETYIDSCLKPIVSFINEQRPQSSTKNIKFHHDNARPHIHKNVISFLESNKFTIMEHPPYSPDLAPSDYWLFSYIKQRLHDHSDEESLKSEIVEIVNSIPKSEWKKTFDKLLERMRLCIENKGDYFEHLM